MMWFININEWEKLKYDELLKKKYDELLFYELLKN